jgi:tetratricopeptide (TPR) repeat protein
MNTTGAKTKGPEVRKEISETTFQRVFLPWTAVLALFHLLSIYVAPAHAWGVHFYYFFPAWIGWVLSLATLVILFPGVAEFPYGKLEALVSKTKKPFAGLSENKVSLLLSLFSLPIFWVFRSRLHLLGDGYLRMRQLSEGKLHYPEWLDGVIHLLAYRFLSKLSPTWTLELTYSTISILSGGLFVFLALKLSYLLGKTGFQRVLVFFSLISLGSIQLFFGYVECYSVLQVMLLAYIFFAALYLSGRISILPALLAFLISIGLHVTSLIFAPSFIYLLIKGRGRVPEERIPFKQEGKAVSQAGSGKRDIQPGEKHPKARSNVPALIASIVCTIAILFWVHKVATGLQEAGKGMFILPLEATESYSFSMFSAAHILEFLNQLLLICPLGISLMIFFVFFRLRFRTFEDRFTNFLILAVSFALVYLFAFNFTLGSADWDLMSGPAPFFGLLGVLLFLKWGEKWEAAGSDPVALNTKDVSSIDSSAARGFKAWGFVLVWFGLFHTIPWVLINANHARSVDRYLLIQISDRHPVDETGYNLYKIERNLKWAGLPEEVETLYIEAIQKDPGEVRNYYNLAALHHRNSDLDRAFLTVDTLLKIDPTYPKANWMMGNILMKRNEYARALTYLEKVLRNYANNADYLYELGIAYSETNQMKKAGSCASRIIRLRPESVAGYRLLASAYTGLGDFEKARQTWKKVLTIDPEDSVAIEKSEDLEGSPKR